MDELSSLSYVSEAKRNRQKLLDFSQRIGSHISDKMNKSMELSRKHTLESHQLIEDCPVLTEKGKKTPEISAEQKVTIEVVNKGAKGFLSFLDQADIAHISASPLSHPLSPSLSSTSPSSSPSRKLSSSSSSQTGRLTEPKGRENTHTSHSLPSQSEDFLSLSPLKSYKDPKMNEPESLPVGCVSPILPSSPLNSVTPIASAPTDLFSISDEREVIVTPTDPSHFGVSHEDIPLRESEMREKGRSFVEREVDFLLFTFCANLKISVSDRDMGMHDDGEEGEERVDEEGERGV